VDDEHRYRRSLAEIRRYLEQSPDTEVVCGHDAAGWPEISELYA
jgi:hypothetical protein